jgi:hypothetical protein
MHDAIMAEVLAEIARKDAERQLIEDHTNRLLNRNRLFVLASNWLASLLIPVIALQVLHLPVLAFFAGSFGYTGAALLTFYAWLRKY